MLSAALGNTSRAQAARVAHRPAAECLRIADTALVFADSLVGLTIAPTVPLWADEAGRAIGITGAEGVLRARPADGPREAAAEEHRIDAASGRTTGPVRALEPVI